MVFEFWACTVPLLDLNIILAQSKSRASSALIHMSCRNFVPLHLPSVMEVVTLSADLGAMRDIDLAAYTLRSCGLKYITPPHNICAGLFPCFPRLIALPTWLNTVISQTPIRSGKT
jgi:hypothetical protein